MLDHRSIERCRQTIAGILDGTLASSTWEYVKPMSYRSTITYLIRLLPEAWQEEWIAREPLGEEGFREYQDRREIGRFDEATVRELWARIDRSPTARSDVPSDYVWLARHLPADLKQQALTRIRASTCRRTRLRHLSGFDDELTDSERRELVEIPQHEDLLEAPRMLAIHIRSLHVLIAADVAPFMRVRNVGRGEPRHRSRPDFANRPSSTIANASPVYSRVHDALR